MPCLREIFHAGPSRDKSTSICESLVHRPREIWKKQEHEVTVRQYDQSYPQYLYKHTVQLQYLLDSRSIWAQVSKDNTEQKSHYPPANHHIIHL